MIQCRFLVDSDKLLGCTLQVPQVPATGDIVRFGLGGADFDPYIVTLVEWTYGDYAAYEPGQSGEFLKDEAPPGSMAVLVHLKAHDAPKRV